VQPSLDREHLTCGLCRHFYYRGARPRRLGNCCNQAEKLGDATGQPPRISRLQCQTCTARTDPPFSMRNRWTFEAHISLDPGAPCDDAGEVNSTVKCTGFDCERSRLLGNTRCIDLLLRNGGWILSRLQKLARIGFPSYHRNSRKEAEKLCFHMSAQLRCTSSIMKQRIGCERHIGTDTVCNAEMNIKTTKLVVLLLLLLLLIIRIT
jgi:hypothetical protein